MEVASRLERPIADLSMPRPPAGLAERWGLDPSRLRGMRQAALAVALAVTGIASVPVDVRAANTREVAHVPIVGHSAILGVSVTETSLHQQGNARAVDSKRDIPFDKLPLEQHLPNGCFIDATSYIARLAKDRPDLKAETFDLEGRFPGQSPTEHTIVLIDDGAHTYARDEYFGVFELSSSATAHKRGSPDFRSEVERELEDHCVQELRYMTGSDRPKMIAHSTIKEREQLVSTAHQLIPNGDLYHIGKEPAIFWRPTSDTVAVYMPKNGTLRTRSTDSRILPERAVMKAVAKEYGLNGDILPYQISPEHISDMASTQSLSSSPAPVTRS